jgi:hypothetical protein
MGERSWARLKIGGRLARAALAEALERLAGRRLKDCLEDNQVVVDDPEAPWGGFSELEAWLRPRGIPFDLESGAWPTCWSTSDPGGGSSSSSRTTATRSW